MKHALHLLKSLFIMASMVEAHESYTGGHLWRVSQYCRLLGESGGLSPGTVARISLGGFLHDLGKVAIPIAILNKPGRLTEDEYQIVKSHALIGNRLLADHPLSELVRDAILAHHERPDGQGYPHGLRDEVISLDAKIVGICDAFDAMTGVRPYRKALTSADALNEIQRNLGSQFDPEWGKRFIELGRNGRLSIILSHRDCGVSLQACPNCGPTIIVMGHHVQGDTIQCSICGVKATVDMASGQYTILPTCRRTSFGEFDYEIDAGFLADLLSECRGHLHPIS